MTPFDKTGVHLDLRIQVMRPEALHKFATKIAGYGFNTLLVEWEATFPLSKHPLISNRYAYTPEEIETFIAHCTTLGIDVIPLQQCFGHMEYILQHERYQQLRESQTDLCQLCPCKADQAVELFEEIFTELIAAHPSPYFHIGGDETYLLGNCPECKKIVERDGSSALYVGYLRQIAELVVKLGKRPMLWADMLLKYPEKASLLPASTIFVDWNYGWAFDRFGDPQTLRDSAFEFWGAAALRSAPDNHCVINWQRHLDNLTNYLPYAKQSGFKGMILTSWSTSGVYGYNWESLGFALDLLPLRRVYPLAGCMLLLDAFKAALQSTALDEAFNDKVFLRKYAAEHFGLSPVDGDTLWQALQTESHILYFDTDFEAAQSKARQSVELLASLCPRRNTEEFAHLQLIADIHLARTDLRVLELWLSSKDFTAQQIPQALEQLEAMQAASRLIDQRFTELNQGDLYPDEIAEECAYRNRRLNNLCQRLKRQRQAVPEATTANNNAQVPLLS